MLFRWRCIFPSRWLPAVLPNIDNLAARKFSAALFNLVFPDDCRVCGSPLHEISRIPVCDSCLSQPKPLVAAFFCAACNTPFLNAFPLDANGRCGLCRRGLAGFDAAYCFGEYDGALRKLIHLFKYDRFKPLAKPLGKLLASALPRDWKYDVIVPMPLHWRRAWERGFNQSELLAAVLAKGLGAPLASVVRRSRRTPPQAGLTNAQRRMNVAGAFVWNKRFSVKGKHVLLVDDVLTTGATAGACAAVLKRAGAKRVTVLTLARVDRRRSAVVSSTRDSLLTGA
jgi:ComF family protein